MAEKKYKVIVSDRAKQMLGIHIRFMAQVNKDAAIAKKKELMAAMRSLDLIYRQISITRCLLKNGILFFIKSKMTQCMWSIFLIAARIIVGSFIKTESNI